MRYAIVTLLLACAARQPAAVTSCRCRPGEPCWPSAAEWQQLGAGLHGKLEQPAAPKLSNNPYALQEQSGATQSQGWLGAWTAARSAYAVVAEDAHDVKAAVDFARQHRLRLVVKGTGHDYLGRSSAPDSLLIWTHQLREVRIDDAFVPRGCSTAPVNAVHVGAGARWMEAYQEVTVKHGRYVQGGGCTSVGAAGGFMQGGGFGSWSKKYGVAAASLLEAEVVTAGGDIVVANACQNADLFWALRGGGGGTFGVVTRVTLQTHPLPQTFGALFGTIQAKNDAAFRALLERFVEFYRASLSDEHWGESVKFRRSNELELSLAFQGLSAEQAQAVWQPLREWVKQRPDLEEKRFGALTIPGRSMWDEAWFKENAPEAIVKDPDSQLWWWADDSDQVGVTWYSYQSLWLPSSLFAQPAKLAQALFDASRQWTVALHFNKGQAGASAEALERDRGLSMNPKVLDAAALVIIATGTSTPDATRGAQAKQRVGAAMDAIRAVAPDAGSYVNETDWFEPEWQRSFWGSNYDRLLEVKHKFDPSGLFWCHHCVGSEAFAEGGFCPAR